MVGNSDTGDALNDKMYMLAGLVFGPSSPMHSNALSFLLNQRDKSKCFSR